MNYFEEIGLFPQGARPLRLYCWGFALSVCATLLAYFLVAMHAVPTPWLIGGVVVLAVFQCIVQGMCFLHLSFEKRSRLKLFILGFAILIVMILVGGSLWIMFHLNERMMADPALMEQYMQDQDAF